MRNKLYKYLPAITGAFIFMIFALYNGYPIVSGDTGEYLESGFNLKVPDERPVFYGLFLRAASLGASIWLAIYLQCLILAYLCIRFIKSILPGIENIHLSGLLFIISLATISGWYAGQILPDIFTPILFLATYLYLKANNTAPQRWLLAGIVYLSIVVHFSHYVIATIFLATLFTGWLIYKSNIGFPVKRLVTLSAITILAWLSLFTSNMIAGKGFVSSNVSHVFIMGKLNESGVLKTYLDKACPTRNYKICAYKDNMPAVAWEFVWDSQNSPVFKTGGWEANKAEYKTIIGDIASRPKYWPFLAYKSIEATLRQVILLNIDEGEERHWIKFESDHPLYKTIQGIFPHEINEFAVSRQNIKTLNITFYDEVYVTVFLLSSLVCMFGMNRDMRKKAMPVYALLIIFLFVNAFATATLGNVLSRLNSRAIWLLPMTNCIFIFHIITVRFHNKALKDGAAAR